MANATSALFAHGGRATHSATSNVRRAVLALSATEEWESARPQWCAQFTDALCAAPVSLACGCASKGAIIVKLTNASKHLHIFVDQACAQSLHCDWYHAEADAKYKDCAMPAPRGFYDTFLPRRGVAKPKARRVRHLVPPKHYPEITRFVTRQA